MARAARKELLRWVPLANLSSLSFRSELMRIEMVVVVVVDAVIESLL